MIESKEVHFSTADIGWDLATLAEKVIQIIEIHLVSMGCVGSGTGSVLSGVNMEEYDQMCVTLQRLLSLTTPLLLHAENALCNTHANTHLKTNYNSNNSINRKVTDLAVAVEDLSSASGKKDAVTVHQSLYPRFARVWSILSKASMHPWGRRESVRYAVLTSYLQEDEGGLKSALRQFKNVRHDTEVADLQCTFTIDIT